MSAVLGEGLAPLVRAATARLAAAGIETPDVDARWLADAFLAGSRGSAGPDALAAFDAAVARRAAREPLQLIVGRVAFHAIELDCAPGVFVPRPETEVLVELALAELARAELTRPGAGRVAPDPLAVLEPCTGSGAIALALAAARPGLELIATDVSPPAVALATANRDRLAVDGRLRSPVVVARADLDDALEPDARVDLVVANPPYLPAADLGALPPEVADHDPVRALIGGPDGHEVVARLAERAGERLVASGALLLEVDARRADDAADRLRAAGFVDVTVHDDLTGRPRFVGGRRPPGER